MVFVRIILTLVELPRWERTETLELDDEKQTSFDSPRQVFLVTDGLYQILQVSTTRLDRFAMSLRAFDRRCLLTTF
jgi:hypothetical protein